MVGMRSAALTAAALTLSAAATAAAQPEPAAEPVPEPAAEPAPELAAEPAVPPERVSVDEAVPTVGRMMSAEIGDVRTNLSDWAVGPPGWDVGGEMVFITSDLGLADDRPLKLTDVGILRARLRYTATRRIELSAAVDALAKQPAYTDELAFQGGRGAMKIAVSRAWALAAGVAGGPALGDGQWGSAATGVVYRKHPHETLSFQLHGGALATALRLPADDPWLTEVTAGGRIMLHTPNGWFGAWAGAELAFPVVHHEALDPATRLDVELGMAYAVVDDWDLFVEASIRDRGDAGLPATQLPILDGGFDQRQLIVGVVRRFDGKHDDGDRDALLIGHR